MTTHDRAAKRAADRAERARLLTQLDHDEPWPWAEPWETTPGLHRALTHLTWWALTGVGVVATLTVTWTHHLDPLLWWLTAVTLVCGALAWRTRHRSPGSTS